MTKLLQGVSLRARVAAGFILIVTLSTALAAFVGSRILSRAMLEEELKQLRQSLRSASMVYVFTRDSVRQSVQGAARSERLAIALEPGGREELPALLARIREEQRLHFLTFVDTRSPRMLRALERDLEQPGADRLPILDYLKHALSGSTSAGTEVLPPVSLRREGQALAQQARIPIHPSPSPDARPEVDSGLTLLAAAPVETRSGFKGVLYGGILLNRDTRLVTRIGDFVFGARHADDASDGIVSLHLGDVRVATNAATPDGEGETGTRAHGDIGRTVVSLGKTFFGRVHAGEDRQLAACQPLRNRRNAVVGMLCVGISDKPLLDAQSSITANFLMVSGIGALIVLGLAFFLTRAVTEARGGA
ncbi:MAG: cache domain-containing protein [Acidobacteria bacterium]|nr:cache domain-containing protein [Acidobacteriota bacterium]